MQESTTTLSKQVQAIAAAIKVLHTVESMPKHAVAPLLDGVLGLTALIAEGGNASETLAFLSARLELVTAMLIPPQEEPKDGDAHTTA